MTGCAMLSADHDKRYGLRTLRAREHRSKRVHASSSILRAPSHVSSSVVARCLLALFMFDVSALARIHERCTHDSVRRLREVVSFPLWFAPSPSKPAGKRTHISARARFSARGCLYGRNRICSSAVTKMTCTPSFFVVGVVLPVRVLTCSRVACCGNVVAILARDGVPGARGERKRGHADSGPVGERRKSNRPRIDSERGA